MQLAPDRIRLLVQHVRVGEASQIPLAVRRHLVERVGECQDRLGLSRMQVECGQWLQRQIISRTHNEPLTLNSGSSCPFGALGLADSISRKLASIAIRNSSSSSSAVRPALEIGGSLPIMLLPIPLLPSAKLSSIARCRSAS
jgi:hypothetical protein